MYKFVSRLTPEWSLRVGLGVMYLYSGIDIIRHPTAWFWAVRPLLKWFSASIQASLGVPEVITKYLVFQGIGELVLAFLFLGWFLPKYLVKWAALVSILEFAGILILIPIDAITFRDIGLLGAFVALWLMLGKKSPNFVSDKNQSDKIEDPSRPRQGEADSGRFASRQPAKQIGSEPVVETFDQFMGEKNN